MTQKFFLKYALNHYNNIDISDNSSYLQLNDKKKTRIFFLRHISIDKEKETFSVTYIDIDDRDVIRTYLFDWLEDGGNFMNFEFPLTTIILNREDVRRISITDINKARK